MDLYAAGFNAWRQLEFGDSNSTDIEPDDLVIFCKVLTDNHFIRVPYASLTCTLVETSTGLRRPGFPDGAWNVPVAGLREKLLSSTAAIAGNGTIATFDGRGSIHQYASLAAFTEATCSDIFPAVDRIIQLEAYETGFVALSKEGTVWTWGDERYSACLGREVTDACPAGKPGVLADLQHLPSGPVRKIAAAGYLGLALTEGHDLYIWGGHPGRQPIVPGVSINPMPVAVEEADTLDCAVGESHIIILTTDGRVYVIGDNANGQLGVVGDKAVEWTRSLLPADTGQPIGVAAGPRSSFILTKHHVP
ncbi:regulator of chromosome condensation 1/beta-lactamase-inhibitor protein II [Xylariaceae sp. FL0804]|nr:regulator of chromosome condensation 1/beta-lactamase-inhibitor protein II [Xylariaceae sp. FL0804]